MSTDRMSTVAVPGRFRIKLLIGMLLLVVALTALGCLLAQREVLSEAGLNMQNDFQNELANLHRVQEVRNAVITEISRNLVMRPRIHAALEDNALDVLYLSARDELREIMGADNAVGATPQNSVLRAKFYRFLDPKGNVIPPMGPDTIDAGPLSSTEEAQLSLPRLPEDEQFGYLVRKADGAAPAIDEIIAIPIVSTRTGEIISALVLGFEPTTTNYFRTTGSTRSGILVEHNLVFPGLSSAAVSQLTTDLARVSTSSAKDGTSVRVNVDGEPYLLFQNQINPGSLFTPAYEVVIYPLAHTLDWEHRLWWQVIAAGAMLLLAGMLASHFLAARLSTPVERLEVDSKKDQAQRQRAEAALETTSAELQRAVRFSADASHQLKTPLTVLRAGLDGLLTQSELRPEQQEEVAALVHQTFRLTCIIEDLLLLSRMEAGRLQISFTSVDLAEIIEALADDLTVQPDALKVVIDPACSFPPITGEKRYVALILQNLLENAWKYNRPGGEIRLACREDGEWARVTIANTGLPIPLAARENIFERFHRASIGENIPGHGLGLNLARELARLHGGDLQLTRSDDKWTEFEVRFRIFRQEPNQPANSVPDSSAREASASNVAR